MTSLIQAPLSGKFRATQHGPDVEKGHRGLAALQSNGACSPRFLRGFLMSKRCGAPSGALVSVGQSVNLQSLGHHFDRWSQGSTTNYRRAA